MLRKSASLKVCLYSWAHYFKKCALNPAQLWNCVENRIVGLDRYRADTRYALVYLSGTSSAVSAWWLCLQFLPEINDLVDLGWYVLAPRSFSWRCIIIVDCYSKFW